MQQQTDREWIIRSICGVKQRSPKAIRINRRRRTGYKAIGSLCTE